MDASCEPRLGSWSAWTGLGSGIVAICWLILAFIPDADRRNQDGWLVAFIVLASLAAAIRTARRLPMQNVVAAYAMLWATALVAFKVVAGMEWLGLGGRAFTGEVASRIGETAWFRAMFGAGLVLASREAGRGLIRCQEGTATYGFQLLGVTMLLTAVGCFNGPWLGEAMPPSREGGALLATRGALCGGMSMLAGLMQIAAAPWLISKRPKSTPPDRALLVGWFMIPVPFLVADCVKGQWVAGGIGGGLAIVVAAWAWRAGCDAKVGVGSRVAMTGSAAV